ncbi:MOSC domain-containing protein [Gloeobacter kilaueensis]|nr:MOSC N-terminal beta barrel domain-containing protein [Gloeobacter kilaueensis]
MSNIVVSGLNVYPVKSCRGIALQTAELDARGICFDRQWMVVDDEGKFITQRTHSRLALVETALSDAQLHLKFPDTSALAFSLEAQPGPTLTVEVWGSYCQAIDQGKMAAEAFSDLLAQNCRLVRMAPEWVRPVNPKYAPAGSQVGFADGYPLLVVSEASLADLNSRLAASLPMERFRPNLVLSGTAPYAEDSWHQIRIGEVALQAAKPCVRCKITTIEQHTAVEQGPEPLRTLMSYRRIEGGPIFGQNYVHLDPGRIDVGDPVVPLAARV